MAIDTGEKVRQDLNTLFYELAELRRRIRYLERATRGSWIRTAAVVTAVCFVGLAIARAIAFGSLL